MNDRSRAVLAVLLILGGLALAGFYYLLFAIADCAQGCVAAGERAVPVGFIGVGIGLAVAGGALLRKRAPRRSAAWGLVVGGAVALLGAALLFAEGSGGLAYWLTGVAIVALVAGATLLRQAGRMRVAPRSA